MGRTIPICDRFSAMPVFNAKHGRTTNRMKPRNGQNIGLWLVMRFLTFPFLFTTMMAAASFGQADELSALIAPSPQPKPGISDRLLDGEKADGALTRSGGELKKRPTPSTASRLKACPALVAGRVSGRYLPAVRTPTLCGDEAPLEVTAVDGVALKPAVQLNCRMTGALVDWVASTQSAARALLQKDLSAVRTASSYVCRRRNNAKDGKFSEHATMNALDVSGFELEGGEQITVKDDWRESALAERKANIPRSRQDRYNHPSTSKARFLRAVHADACKNFTTVLGPDGDAHHQDHFHLDLGCHGKTCTWRICQ